MRAVIPHLKPNFNTSKFKIEMQIECTVFGFNVRSPVNRNCVTSRREMGNARARQRKKRAMVFMHTRFSYKAEYCTLF